MASRGKEGWDYIIGSDWHCVSRGLDTLVLDRIDLKAVSDLTFPIELSASGGGT